MPVRTYENGNQQERMDIISNANEEMGLRFRTVEITPEVRKENDDIRIRVTDNNLTGFKIKTNRTKKPLKSVCSLLSLNVKYILNYKNCTQLF